VQLPKALRRLLRRRRPPDRPTDPREPSEAPIRELVRRLDPSRLDPGVVLVQLDDSQWSVTISDEACTLVPGDADQPSCTVRTTPATLRRVLDGTLAPERAYLTGAVRTSNPAYLAAILRALRRRGPEGEHAAEPRRRAPSAPVSASPAGVDAGPLTGVTVVDLTRMVPGAILARQLIDLGARWIKVEAPSGDPMRHLEPTIDGIGAGFATLLRGAESVCVDLKTREGIDAVERLARQSDVLVESFRPATLQSWGLSLDALRESAPRLITCSLSAYGASGPGAAEVAHDLNLTAITGALTSVGGGIPHVQLADVGCGLLASTAILAALLERTRTGRGRHVEQPLVTGPLPLLAWAWADAAAGGGGLPTSVLAGHCPGYRRYRCSDGLELAIAAIEPKFWQEILRRLDLEHLASTALDCGPAGHRASAELEAVLASQPREHWLGLFSGASLPATPVHTIDAALHEPLLAPFRESTPTGAGSCLDGIGPFLPSFSGAPRGPAPALGEHTARVLEELTRSEPSE
jgi:crotonobetainyl-CoA:carnitine CoA-transferase CaiB-like acyl-CoA transferase